jgi:hypothetical protein
MQSHIRSLFTRAWLAAAAMVACAASAASLDVNPLFPAYGQTITAQLNAVGALPYIPATRYRRDGNVVVIEFEHIRGGYFGWRTDIGYMPVSVGELGPGHYTRLSDMANPQEAAWLFTQAIDVAAPDMPGVYPVPSKPGAYENVQLLVRADGPIDSASLRASLSPGAVRIDFDYSPDTTMPSFATVAMPALAPGVRHVEAYGHIPNVALTGRSIDGDFTVDGVTTAVEYYADSLDHYFITAWPDEIAVLDAGTAFKRTGERFKTWLHSSDAPEYAVPVCRFYASGPNSHFYTADPAECQYLKSLQQKQAADAAAKGQPFAGWQFEAIAFFAIAPQDGACPAGTQPIYRAYNGRAAENDSNHRFMARKVIRDAMLESWHDEGIAFCAALRGDG